jgi:hypothetical protein
MRLSATTRTFSRQAVGANLPSKKCGGASGESGIATFHGVRRTDGAIMGRSTGLDPEAAMIAAAKDAAAAAGVALSLVKGRIEEFPATQAYDLVTIGRALHWLDRSATLAVLERIVVPDSGRILICGASSVETPETPWVKAYKEVRRAWSSEPDDKHYRIDGKEWFAGSCFSAIGETSVTERRQVTIADLIGRALSRSNTSPEVVAEGKPRFEAELTAALEPFVQNGVLVEQIVARASIFGRVQSGDKRGLTNETKVRVVLTRTQKATPGEQPPPHALLGRRMFKREFGVSRLFDLHSSFGAAKGERFARVLVRNWVHIFEIAIRTALDHATTKLGFLVGIVKIND